MQGRRQRKMSGGDKTKKFETYGYNFRSLWHMKYSIFLFYAESLVHAIITRK